MYVAYILHKTNLPIDISPSVHYVTCQVSSYERANLTTIHATASVFRTPSHNLHDLHGLLTQPQAVKYAWYVRSRVLLTQAHLTSVYITQNDQLQRPWCTAEGFWCVRLCSRSWTLDFGGPTDENLLNSCSRELLARHKWDLHVRVFCCVNLPLSCTSIRTPSWEYVTTLDFELDIVLGRRPYRWTILVCYDTHFFACRYLSFEIRADLPVR